jgi:hypothetical protein
VAVHDGAAVIARSRIALAALLLGVASACLPFPRWTYTAQTQVTRAADANGFSASEITRARTMTADVGRSAGMQLEDQDASYLEVEAMISAAKSPRRLFLATHKRKQLIGLPIELRLEVSEDGRVLWFSVSDYEHGSPLPEVVRVTARLRERVEAEFPKDAIVHEALRSGPIFDHP